MSVGCWNVRTLLDRQVSGRPERQTALVCEELCRLDLDIVALSETRLSAEDHLKEISSDYTIFWSGKPTGVKRESGVGFAMKSSIADKIEHPEGISDRIMRLRVPLTSGRFLSMISVYSPTLKASAEDLNSFYNALSETVNSVPKEDKLIILGDFNARVGADNSTWSPLGRYGVGKINNNGLRLLEFCTQNNLAITNTFFRQKLKHKATWYHPRSGHGHLIDFIITRKSNLADICNVKVLRSAECGTDHKLVRGKFKFCIRKKVRMEGVKVPKRIDVSKLMQDDICKQFQARLDQVNLEESWDQFKNNMYTVGAETLGFKQRKHQDWFDDNNLEIKELLDEKHRQHLLVLNASAADKKVAQEKFKKTRAVLQSKLRDMKNAWWTKLSNDIQSAYDTNNSKVFYDLLGKAYGPSSSSITPLKSLDGKSLAKNPTDIMSRWTEHFGKLFFNPSEVDDDVINSLPQLDFILDMDKLPTFSEVEDAIRQVNTGKAPGLDGIAVELLQSGGDKVVSAILHLFTSCWEGQPIPQDWVNGVLVTLFKNKGLKSECDNYRGITLLEAVGKVLARLLLNRLNFHICPRIIPEAQCGFRKGRGTRDMIFSVRQIQEKCLEQRVALFQVFVDLTKAFDTVNRNALWRVLSKLGCPPKFVRMIAELHRDMKGQVTINGILSDEIPIENGVKQGDILAPTLFSIYFSVLLSYAFKNCEAGVYIRFRSSGSVFDLSRLKAKTKTLTALIRELLYADDADFIAHSEQDMQLIMDCFSSACKAFGLTISIKKTKVMFTPPPGTEYYEPSIYVEGVRLDVVNTFPYLGSTMSRDGALDAEIHFRIGKASSSYAGLQERVWSDRDLTNATKLSIYNTCVLKALLYACETWTPLRRHFEVLETFHHQCLRRILKIKWQAFMPDTEVLGVAKFGSIESIIMQERLCWSGNIVRMEDTRIPKQLLFGELTIGKRPQHGVKRRYKDCLKSELKGTHINTDNWQELALNPLKWKDTVKEGCKAFESNRIDRADMKRKVRKKIPCNIPEDVKTWPCEHCGRVLLSKAGYTSHVKIHLTENVSLTDGSIPIRPDDVTCVICLKTCKSTAGLKRHMKIHKDQIPQQDPINPIKCTSNVCHICHKPFKTNAGLQSHLRAHVRQAQKEQVT